MNALQYFQSAIKELHNRLSDSIKDLSQEQLHFQPIGKGNHIAFTIWHCVRTEDTVINFIVQKKPPVWNAEGWDKKFGMDPRAQGTGMTAEQAASISIPHLQDFRQYMENVFQASETYLSVVQEGELEPVQDYQFLGKRSGYQVIGGVILQHGAGHLNEIWYLKGLQGLKGSPM